MKIDTGNIVEQINEEEILKRTTEYDIYAHYLPYKFEIGRIMSSPFREDVHPSFGIFKHDKTGALLFKDHATGDIGNCFKFVSLLFDLKYSETLDKIWNEIVTNNVISEQGIVIRDYYKNKKTIVSVKRKNFTKTDDDYWGQYYLSRDILKKYNVFPIKTFWVGDYISKFTYTEKSPMYAYKIFNSFKVYRPYTEHKKDKWRSGCGQYDIQGWEQLPEQGDILVITKSLKDVMVLSLFGIPSIAPHGENTLVPQKVVNEAKKRFKRLIMLYDYDDGGLAGVKKMQKEYDIPYTFIPKHYLEIYGVKDISDHIKEFGKQKTKKLLKELLYASSETKT
jgi:hypothetical protein